ncbi:TonB-dependent receptor [Pseudodesulfovibrio sp. F-1]|uniref:TonB-dependent receptor n=1 Tax=Pseudodesulfovibrio alkaliphilus TaxID=2661613 RepID=A0A7K1KKX1_9BACT|nr:TonB-dependent receptor [Pseudodesulfovibrio alkaliphilus]MUM76736.1 TonB-dependent receptor [Pseudodesulfovibrio alkaliphilus]
MCKKSSLKLAHRAVAFALVALLTLPGVAAGKNPEKKAAQQEKGKTGIILDTVVVSATRTEVSAFEAPASVSVVGEEEINREQPTTIRDLLENIPNVDFSSGTSTYFQVPSIRGLEDEQTIIKIDGARQLYNDNAGNARTPIVIEPTLLKQVEVVRGPSSTLHGSGGIGGVISMQTKDASDMLRPGEKFGAQIRGGHQSVDSQEWLSSTAYAGDDFFGLVANLTTRDFGHMRTSDPDSSNSVIYRTGSSTTNYLKGSITPSEGQYASLAYNRFEDVFHTAGGSVYRTNQTQVTGNYNLSPADNDWLDLRAVGQYTYRANSSQVAIESSDNMVGWGGDIQNTFRFGTEEVFHHTLTAGTDYYIDHQKGSDATRPKATGWDYGMFIQDNISLPYGFSLIPAARYTQYSRKESSGQWASQKESEITPKVTANWKARKWLNLFVTYAESFRPPSLNEIYFFMDWPGFGQVVPNPDLKPEKGKTWEYGTGLTFDGVFTDNDPLRIKAVYFREIIKDFQSAVFIGGVLPNMRWTTVNTGSVRRFGYEAEMHYAYERYAMSLTYGKVMGMDEETGARVGQTPEQVGLRVHCDIPEYDLGLTWKSDYTAESKGYQPWNGSTDTVPDYHIHGFAVAWTPKSLLGYEGLRADLGVDNLFDKKYITYRGAWDRGRNVKLGLSLTF